MRYSLVFATATALMGSAQAFWRMPCHGRTGLARIDPIVDAGEISGHPHAIHGGSNFGFNATYQDLLDSDCTSCGVYQDKSAYWTPPLLFQFPNGTTEVVPQVGGMLAYYLLYTDPTNLDEKIVAFPENFRMVAGDNRQRNFTWPVPDPPKSDWSGDMESQFSLEQHALGFNCLNYAKDPEASLYRHFLPTKDYLDANCVDGIRLELMFPSCWNGNDTDSPNHKSHMAYPTQVMTGSCPEGFETRVPSMFFETIWNTYAYNGIEGQFVLGNGDPTGFGYHGDFMTGWDVDFLQSAVDTCTNLSGNIQDCPLFSLQPDSSATTCSFPVPSVLKNDDCAGPREGICGNVPVQSGPAYATLFDGGAASSTPAPIPHQTPTSTTMSSANIASLVPTSLGYSKGTSLATDNSGGGITVAAVPHNAKAPVATTTTEIEAAAAPTPDVTPSPESASADNGNANIVSTSAWVSDGAAYELYIEEVDTFTTVTVDAPSKQRRHMHHRRGYHAGLGKGQRFHG